MGSIVQVVLVPSAGFGQVTCQSLMIVVFVVGGGAVCFLVLSISREGCANDGLAKASTSRMMPARFMG